MTTNFDRFKEPDEPRDLESEHESKLARGDMQKDFQRDLAIGWNAEDLQREQNFKAMKR